MSSYVEIVALVEGKTEQIFIQSMVTPYLAAKNIFMTPIIVSKPGQKGGDVKFARVKNDIELHLKQRRDTFLTLFIDYYGIKGDWPGLVDAKKQSIPSDKAEKINNATRDRVVQLSADCRADRRFIPFVAVHEFEALLFSDPRILAEQLGVRRSDIDEIIRECGEPENIDDSPVSAPSKRLQTLSERFKKTSTGIAIAKAIGLEKIRAQCPLFNTWLSEIEMLTAALSR
jgi:hypothetical protein